MENIKRFDFQKKPRKTSRIMYVIILLVCFPRMLWHRFKLKKINMKGLKPPYLCLCNHASEIDFYILFKSIFPHLSNYVVAIDGFHDHGEWIMRFFGSIGKRKFTRDPYLLKNLRYCADNLKSVITIYPEARYTFDGTTSYFSPTTGMLAKRLGIPVVVLNSRGNFVSCPQWNKEFKFCRIEASMEQILTAEQLREHPVDKINELIKLRFVYDDFAWQRKEQIKINHPRRAQGLNRILYKCSSCMTEGEMHGEGTTLTCAKCGKTWEMSEYGELNAADGKETFTHIPDWYRWERECVREELINGTYYFEDEIMVETLPGAKKFLKQGIGKIVQTCDGLTIDCVAYGEPVHLFLPPLMLESLHVEFNYRKIGDCCDVSTLDESYWCYPKNHRDAVMKMALAAEESFMLAYNKVIEKRRAARFGSPLDEAEAQAQA
ncbi:MAG: hypothetical protein PHW77_07215 [Eubacteriales bacterium]|nr:hypothetical protein [Eubacteriales bacterium]